MGKSWTQWLSGSETKYKAEDMKDRGSIPRRVISFMKVFLHEIDGRSVGYEGEKGADDDDDEEKEEEEEERVLTKEEQSYIPPCR